ncbi:MAG: sigma 54 modulation protein / ribosomal protein [Thermoleophilia bacterium]|nr:sigma 54 modulation protein / ribosomal protein [Thermoleophilia bacterium]
MKLLVKGKNVDVSRRVQEYAEKRLSKLSVQLDDAVTSMELEITQEKNPRVADSHRAEVTVWTKGRALRASESSPDVYASIDLVADKLARQVKKYHDKRVQARQGGAHGHDKDRWKGALQDNGNGNGDLPAGYEFETQTMEDGMAIDSQLRIVKTKQFSAGPLTPEEAAEQMSLVGHDFFVFVNDETDETCVLYKRADGQFGLIEPSITELKAKAEAS